MKGIKHLVGFTDDIELEIFVTFLNLTRKKKKNNATVCGY